MVSTCISSFLTHSLPPSPFPSLPPSLPLRSDSTGQTGLHYATQVVMNLLDPARPEYSAAFVDKLIIVFVKKVKY